MNQEQFFLLWIKRSRSIVASKRMNYEEWFKVKDKEFFFSVQCEIYLLTNKKYLAMIKIE